jgi:NAD+ diphosphatase
MSAADSAPTFAFAHATLDRAGERREDEAWIAQARVATVARYLPVRADGRVFLAASANTLCWLDVAQAREVGVLEDASFLGLLDAQPLFALRVEADAAAASTMLAQTQTADLRRIAGQLDATQAGIAAYARALLHWQSRKRYCGRCGQPTRFAASGHRALCTDAQCGQEYFPRTDAAIIVAVADTERCLLGRGPSWPERRYSTLAGFVEPGESLEHAVAREVAEESGVRVARVRYFASQPWPFPASLMLGFHAEPENDRIVLGAELADARWWHKDEIEPAVARGDLILPTPFSISYFLIADWYRTHTGRRLPPGMPL